MIGLVQRAARYKLADWCASWRHAYLYFPKRDGADGGGSSALRAPGRFMLFRFFFQSADEKASFGLEARAAT